MSAHRASPARRRPVATRWWLLLLPLLAFGALWWRNRNGSEVPAARAPAAPATLEDHVRSLASLDPPRSAAHPQSLERAAAYIEAELRAAGGAVRAQEFDVGGIRYRNVCARFGPESGEWSVVGAHYDVFDGPGADDNASGVAVLLAVAHLLGQSALDSRVELVAFTLEEPPHFGSQQMGSAVYAQALRADGVGLRGMLCLEMVGFFRDEPKTQRYPFAELRDRYPSTGNFLAIIGRLDDRSLIDAVQSAMAAASSLPLESLAAPAGMPGVDLSDATSTRRVTRR